MPKRGGAVESVFMSQLPLPDEKLVDEELGAKWDQILKLRGEILKGLEEARNKGLIGHSLDAKVVLYPDTYNHDASLQNLLRAYDEQNWADIAIVSRVKLQPGELPEELWEAQQALQSNLFGAAAPIAGKGWSYTSSLLRGAIAMYKAEADGEKCERCWKYDQGVKEPAKVCFRCSAVLGRGVPA